MQLILRSSAAKIRATFTGPDGEAVVPTNPTVTITRDSDGVEIATTAAATSEGGGVVSYTLDSADAPDVDLLHASWSANDAGAPDADVGVVGGFLCSLEAIAEVIQAGGGQWSVEMLRAKREQAERKLEDACGVAFRPTYARETITGRRLSRRRPLRVLSVDGEASVLSFDLGGTLSSYTDGTVAYVHGYPAPPEPISRACVKLAAHYIEGAGDDRINRFREDDQEVWLSMPGAGGETGIPEVDQAIRSYRVPVLA